MGVFDFPTDVLPELEHCHWCATTHAGGPEDCPDVRAMEAASGPEVPSPAGPARADAALPSGPAASPGVLPPAGPCRSLDGELDVCGCPLYWLDAYGRLHCWACEPPGAPALVRRRLRVVLAPGGSFAWEHDAREAAAVSEASEWDVHELPDGWTVIQRRIRPSRFCQPIPIEQSIDDWWREAGERAATERRAVEFDRARWAGAQSAAEKNAAAENASKKTAAKKRAEKKPASKLAGFDK